MDAPLLATVGNEGLGWDPFQKKCVMILVATVYI